jgi:5-methylcytosine-specific restriction enzyme B
VGLPLDGPTDPQVRTVQFHQSYSYEDFVEGIRPDANAAHLSYKVMAGIFKRLCDDARVNPDKQYVLIIDEINRGNLSRIFGELLMLLEYRDMEVELPYQVDGQRFSIPKNVHIIGTMNTTDRSLAQIDYALRRRFYFYRLMPVEGDSAPVLSRWLESQSISADERSKILDLFIALNAKVTSQLGEHFQVGHSYFMNDRIKTTEGRQQIWNRAVMPLLEEYFHNRKERQKLLAEFSIEKLGGAALAAGAGQ